MKKTKTKTKEDKIDRLFLLAVRKSLSGAISTKKIKDFLFKKGATKEEIKIILEKLNRYSLINEDELVKNIISYADAKHYGYNKIISLLKSREISLKKIKLVRKDEQRELEHAQKLVKTLIGRHKNKNTVNLRKAIYSSLIRYGFDESIASTIILDIYNSSQKELDVLKLDYQKLLSSYSRKLKGKDLIDKLIKTLLSKGYSLSDIKKIITENSDYEIN